MHFRLAGHGRPRSGSCKSFQVCCCLTLPKCNFCVTDLACRGVHAVSNQSCQDTETMNKAAQFSLHNDDESEVRHLTALLKQPGPYRLRVITWSGGWQCPCGRVCWPRQHCKACGQVSPCRGWCFEGRCEKANCKYPHPAFYLPAKRPAVDTNGRPVDGREQIVLPPPGTLPAVERLRRQQELAHQQKSVQRAMASPFKGSVAAQKLAGAYVSSPPAAPQAAWVAPGPRVAESSNVNWPMEANVVATEAADASTGTGGKDVWADLVARAKAAMPGGVGSDTLTAGVSENSSLGSTPKAASLAGSNVMAEYSLFGSTQTTALATPQAQTVPGSGLRWQAGTGAADGGVNWEAVLAACDDALAPTTAVSGVHGQHPGVAAGQDPQDAELEQLLALLCTA